MSTDGYHGVRARFTRAITRPPYTDPTGSKGWLERVSRAQPHLVRHLQLSHPGWFWSRPLRIAFISDFHTGSHSRDVERLIGIVGDVASYSPDLAIFGGDYVNLQSFGGGRVPPSVTASVLAQLDAPLGRFAILGNHDYVYGADSVREALQQHGLVVLEDESQNLAFEGHSFRLAGIPDAHVVRPNARKMLARLNSEPTIVVAHDPIWFAFLPVGPYIMLAGHTHGGQVRLPFIGALRNASKAPLRWTYGLIREEGKILYVTSGIGTSLAPIRLGIPPEFVILDLTTPGCEG